MEGNVKKIEGSMTVEAALIIPLVLVMFAMTMTTGLQMYEECRETAVELGAGQDLNIIQKFYLWNELGEMWEHGD